MSVYSSSLPFDTLPASLSALPSAVPKCRFFYCFDLKVFYKFFNFDLKGGMVFKLH